MKIEGDGLSSAEMRKKLGFPRRLESDVGKVCIWSGSKIKWALNG